MALVRETEHITTVLGLFALIHRGRQISAALLQRAHFRRRRRSTNLRYRAPRFSNRTKPAGWLPPATVREAPRLPPSLQHRVETTVTWVNRLQRLAPIAAISVELVRFDLQLLEHPDIAGVAYQQGTLAGYELREYLLEKWRRQCAYCDKQDVPLQIEHIIPTSNRGSHRVPNLTLACGPCHQHKGSRDIRDFVKDDTRLQRILAHAKFPRGYLARKKQVQGFQTGDLLKAVVPSGKKVGRYLGRVAVRASGSFNIQSADGVVQGISYKHCRVLQRNDGYGYAQCSKIAATA